jgi:MATE family multidrug resistance protein
MDVIYIITEGSLRGAGDTRWPFMVEMVLGWGLLLPLAYLLGVVLEGGLMGAWYGSTIYIVVLAAMFVRRFHSRAWQQIKI